MAEIVGCSDYCITSTRVPGALFILWRSKVGALFQGEFICREGGGVINFAPKGRNFSKSREEFLRAFNEPELQKRALKTNI